MADAAEQLAPLTRQPMCSPACKAAYQPGAAAGSRVLQNQCLKSEIQELVLKKLAVLSAALPSKSKAAFRVVKSHGLNSQDQGQWHILVACGHHLVLRAVLGQREAISVATAGAGMQSGRRHTVLAQGALCLIPCLTQLFCGTLPVNAHRKQRPVAAVGFEVSAGGTVEEKQVSCSPLSSCVPAEAGKSLTLNASLEDVGWSQGHL